MGRFAIYPPELEELNTLTITFLKKHDYLKPYCWRGGSATWTYQRSGIKNSITIHVRMEETTGTINLSYTVNGTDKYNYDVQLISRKSNIGNGLLWFFVCPKTKRVCRKLHFHSGYFLHRTAFRLNYHQQNQSKKMRYFTQRFGGMFIDDVYSELYKKHFKRYYNGQPTKKYVRLMQKIEDKENIDFNEFEKALLM